MRTLKKTSIISILMLLSLNFVLAAKGNIGSKNLENSEKTLLSAIESDNLGLSISSIQILGELNLNSAVIPLMKILHNSDNTEIRIAASLALYKISDKRGIYALKMAAKYDNSERVRKMCSNFYTQYLLEHKIT
ncbi:hypothetical protein MNBD_IGNAVI01-189 [hydrothermal vent metagenome]|uniref:HEAT repeat domain-containing protein n=1 Tax=hydrothermal vent metagenome TaxID=652676 RepID=A0A3B1CNN6_9ZZZZ